MSSNINNFFFIINFMSNFPTDFFRSWVRLKVLHTLFLKKTMFISSLMRDLNSTYSQVWKQVNELSKIGLLTKTAIGRVIMLSLTEDGEKVGKSIDEMVTVIEAVKLK